MFSPARLIKKRISYYDAEIYTFAIFGCVFFLSGFFIINFDDKSETLIMFLVLGASLCFVLLIKDYLISSYS